MSNQAKSLLSRAVQRHGLLLCLLLLSASIAGCNKDKKKDSGKEQEQEERGTTDGPADVDPSNSSRETNNSRDASDSTETIGPGVTVKTTFDPKNPGQPSVTVNGKQLQWNTDAQAPPQDQLYVIRGTQGQRIPIKAGVVSKDLLGYRLTLQNQPRGCSGVGLIPDDLIRFSLTLKKSLTPEGLRWQVKGYRYGGKSSGLREEVKGEARNVEVSEDGMSGELLNVTVPGESVEDTLLIDGRFSALYCEHNMNADQQGKDAQEKPQAVEGDLTLVIAGEEFPVRGAVARMLGGRPMVTLSPDPLTCRTVMGRDADLRLKLTPGIKDQIGQVALSGELIPFGSMPHTKPGESGLEWTLGEPEDGGSGQKTMRVDLSGSSDIGGYGLSLQGSGVDALLCDGP